MSSGTITVKFWGVRGSHPVPGAGTVRVGGNTSSVEVRANGQTIILDAGTGIIGLGKELDRRSRQNGTPTQVAVLFSHLHHDHTQGFPFFTPAYNPAAQLLLFGPGGVENAVEEALTRAMSPPAFPLALHEMGAAQTIRGLQEGEALWMSESLGGAVVRKAGEQPPEGEAVVVRVLRSSAHPGGVLLFRLEWAGRSVVYATDLEGVAGGDPQVVEFARGASLLIHDAQFTEAHYRGLAPGLPATRGYGHSTSSMASEVARSAGVNQLVLFHHDPSYEDDAVARIEKQARLLFGNTLAAREGLEITLGPEIAPGAPVRLRKMQAQLPSYPLWGAS